MSLRCLGTSGYNEAQFRPNYLGKVYEAAQQKWRKAHCPASKPNDIRVQISNSARLCS